MADEQKEKEQLVSELAALRQGFARLQALLTKHKQVGALCDIGQTVNETLEPDELIDCALGKAVEVIDADMGLVYLLDMTEKALLLKAHRGVSEQAVTRISPVKFTKEDLRKMPKREALDNSFSELFRDATLRLISSEIRGGEARSFAAAPFLVKDGLHGVIVVGTRSQHGFSQDDMELLGAVSKQMRVGIENAVLFQEVTRLATIDRLTGLYNQAYFQRRLEEEVARSSRYGLEFSVIMIDVDGFEAYVTRRGYVAGNEIIKMLGISVHGCVRAVDIVCRYGGSKFAIILPHTDLGGAQVVAERLRQKAFDIFALTRRSSGFELTISLGIASFPTDELAPDGLVRRAEVALAMALKRRGNQACLASGIPSSLGTAISDVSDVTEHVKESSVDVAYAMAGAADAKTHKAHSRNVAKHAVAIGEVLGLSRTKIRYLRSAALLHDIGKAHMPDSILRKSVPSSEEEQILRKHPELGATITSQIPELAYCAPAIRHHHERYDGSGYPQGLKGEQIPIEASIIAVADAYDNMTSPRSFHRVLSPREAIEELRRHVNTEFAPEVVLAFIKAISPGA